MAIGWEMQMDRRSNPSFQTVADGKPAACSCLLIASAVSPAAMELALLLSGFATCYMGRSIQVLKKVE